MAIFLIFMLMPTLVWIPFSWVTKRSVNGSLTIKRNYLIVCGILIFLMMALRHYTVGSGDGRWYYNHWWRLSELSFKEFRRALASFDVEVGYMLYAWVLSHIFKDPQFVFILYGLLVAVSVCIFTYRNCEDAVMGLTMFVCLGLWGFMVQGIRQGMAMCLCLFAIEYCKQRKLWIFLIYLFIAIQLHASAIVFLVAYTLTMLKLDGKSYLITAVGFAMAMLMMDKLFQLVNFFIKDTYALGDDRGSGGFITATIYVLIIAFTVVFYKPKNEKEERNMSFFFYMVLVGMVTYLMRYSASAISQRAAYYFMFGQMATLPTLVNRIFKGRQKMLVTMIIVTLCLGIAAYKASYSVLVPYIFFWQA